MERIFFNFFLYKMSLKSNWVLNMHGVILDVTDKFPKAHIVRNGILDRLVANAFRDTQHLIDLPTEPGLRQIVSMLGTIPSKGFYLMFLVRVDNISREILKLKQHNFYRLFIPTPIFRKKNIAEGKKTFSSRFNLFLLFAFPWQFHATVKTNIQSLAAFFQRPVL